MFKRRSLVTTAFAAVAALVGSTLGAAPASADVLFVIDVSAGLSAPASADGAFAATATITNSGTIGDQAGSRLAVTATGGSITSAPGCSISGGVATCTATSLPTGQSASFVIGITPAPGATSVATQAVATAALIEANVLDVTNNTASASTSLAYGVDGGLTNAPTTVRNGEDVLLTATVTNTKTPQNVNVVLASGGTIDTRIQPPAGCAVTNANKNLSCTFALGTGGSKTFDIAVATPTSGNSLVSTLNISGASGGAKSASATTTLNANAQAFVPEGDFITYNGTNQATTFNVPVGSTEGKGSFVQLRQVTLNGTQCGTDGTCIKEAAEALFPSTGKYAGHDPNKPFIWEIQYDHRRVCNGNINSCNISIYWIPSDAPLTYAQPMQQCPTFSSTASVFTARLNNLNDPCLQKIDKGKSGYSTYTVAVLRDIVIPLLSGGKLG